MASRYDDAGNRASETVTRTAATANATAALTTRSYSYNARNQLTLVSQSGADGNLSTTYGYDPQGNQLNKTRAGLTTTYGYDAHDQLISVARDGTVLGNYRNNHLGLRIEKQAKDPLNPQGPPATLRTLWDGHDAILDQNESGQVIARYDFAGRAPIGLWHKQDGVQALHADALGSIVLATDDKGTSKAETLFDAWGNPIVDEGQSGNKFGYTGHQMDEESGLIYAQARYYDPETGRFLTQDPAEGDPEAPLSYNSYLYAYGNPTVYIDPTGMYSVNEFGDDLKEVGGKARRGLKRAGREASYAAGFVTGGALGATHATIDAAIEMGKVYADNQLSLIGNREAIRRNTERLKALGRALWEAKANVARVKDYINKEEAGAQREYAEGNSFTAGVVRGRVVGEAATIVIPGVEVGVTAARGLAKAAALTAEKVGAAASRRAERLAAAGTRTAEAAGVGTELSSTVKASDAVTAEKAGGPAASADVNRATGSAEAETSPRSFSLWSGSGDRIGPSKRSQRGAVGDLSAATTSASKIGSFGKVPDQIATSSGYVIRPVADKTTTILGRWTADMDNIINTQLTYPKTTDFGPKVGGYNVLNVDTSLAGQEFWNTYNKPFLDLARARNDVISVATVPKIPADIMTFDGVPTGMFGREFEYLVKHDYRPANIGWSEWQKIKSWYE